MKRPKGTHPIYWRSFSYSPPDDWLPIAISEMACVTKGKLPKTLLPHPTERSVPYLLIDGLNNGASLHTEDTDLPMITPEDTIVVADGSRSGLPIRGVSGALGSTLLRYRAKEGFDGDYLYYLLESLYPFTNTATIGGAVPHLDKRLLSQLVLKTPGQAERKIIGRVLRAVDEMLSATNAELLAAQRLKTALMQQLFTKGIPGRHKKFRTVNLGRRLYLVPGVWEVKKVQDLLSEKLVNGVSPQSRPDPPGIPILNVSCISEGNCDLKKVTYVDADNETFNIYRAKKGDFFVLRGNGNNDYVACGGLLRVEPNPACMFSDLLIRLRFNDNVVTGFMPWMWQSQSFLRRLQSKAKSGSGLWKIGLRDIRHQFVFLPKRDEQEIIVEILDSCEDAQDAIRTKIDSLLQLKKSLLQNLLTGKVRVNMEAKV